MLLSFADLALKFLFRGRHFVEFGQGDEEVTGLMRCDAILTSSGADIDKAFEATISATLARGRHSNSCASNNLGQVSSPFASGMAFERHFG